MIIWKIKDECEDKDVVKANVKKELEALTGKIDGLIEMHIITDKLPSSSGDLMMDSLFESEDALKAYQKHPLHQHVANTFVRPNMCQRLSLDYEIKNRKTASLCKCECCSLLIFSSKTYGFFGTVDPFTA